VKKKERAIIHIYDMEGTKNKDINMWSKDRFPAEQWMPSNDAQYKMMEMPRKFKKLLTPPPLPPSRSSFLSYKQARLETYSSTLIPPSSVFFLI
jgi:hypothetical protein